MQLLCGQGYGTYVQIIKPFSFSSTYNIHYTVVPLVCADVEHKWDYCIHFAQVISVTKTSGSCGGMPELLLASSLVLSIVCLFVFPCVLACTIPSVAVSIAVSSWLYFMHTLYVTV